MPHGVNRPECTKEKVLTYIASSPAYATINSLQKFFQLTPEETHATLAPILKDLENNGKILKAGGRSQNTKNFRYKPSEKEQVSDLMVVRIDRIEGNDVFVKPVTVDKKSKVPSMKLGSRDSKNYKAKTHIGEKLLVRIKNRGGWDKENDQVLVHCLVEQELKHGASGLLTGTVTRAANNNELRFIPDLKGNTITFPFSDLALPDMEEGDHILASICEDFDQALRPIVKPIERVWRPGQQSSKIGLHVLSKNGVRLRTPDKIEQQAARFAKTVTFENYEDLRDIPLVTIDGRDANERDDAVGAVIDTNPDNPGGYILYTAIADASEYVPVSSNWDDLAMEDPFSKYAFGRNVDMLPKSIVHNYCSLNENVDRPAIVLERRMNRHGDLIQSNFKAGIVNIQANLSYDRVDQALNTLDQRPFPSDLQKLVETYHTAAQIRHQYYLQQGMLELDDAKVYPVFDEHGMVKEITKEENSPSRLDIKVGMIDYSLLAGEVITDADINFVGRVHDDPDEDMIDRAAERLKAFNIHMPNSDEDWTPFDYGNAMREAQRAGQPTFLKNSVAHIILSGIKAAQYEWNGEGHFGVATRGAYPKATSPLRDAAQLINQRALKKAIGIYNGPISAFEDDYHGIAEFEKHLNQEEYKTKDTQRQALQAYAIESLAHLKNTKVAAQVIGYSATRGLSLRIDNCPVVFDMPMDNMKISNDRKFCINTMTGERTEFGSYIDITIKKADPMKNMLEIELQVNRLDTMKKATPGRPSFRRNAAPMPRAKPCKAKVLEASTKTGLTLELDLPHGKKIYKWPRDGYSFGARPEGVLLYPNKKNNRRGMLFIEGETVELMVRLSDRGRKLHAVEIPKQNNNRPSAATPRQEEGPRLNSFEELGEHFPAPE